MKKAGAPPMNCNGCGRFMPVTEAWIEPDGGRRYIYWCSSCGREQDIDLPAPNEVAHP